jgi:hypothetical protein
LRVIVEAIEEPVGNSAGAFVELWVWNGGHSGERRDATF